MFGFLVFFFFFLYCLPNIKKRKKNLLYIYINILSQLHFNLNKMFCEYISNYISKVVFCRHCSHIITTNTSLTVILFVQYNNCHHININMYITINMFSPRKPLDMTICFHEKTLTNVSSFRKPSAIIL